MHEAHRDAGVALSAGKAGVRPERAQRDAQPKRASLDMAIRKLQLARAVTLSAERAATHDLVPLDCVADVLVAILPLIDSALEALDQVKVRP